MVVVVTGEPIKRKAGLDQFPMRKDRSEIGNRLILLEMVDMLHLS